MRLVTINGGSIAAMNDLGWAAVGGAIGAFFTGLFAWLAQRTQGASSIEVAVLSEWQKLNAALSDRLSAVEQEFAKYRIDMSREMALRDRQHAEELREIREKHRSEMRALRELNEGLQRQIAQNSQSGANLLGDMRGKSE